jgi:hypothetical protein
MAKQTVIDFDLEKKVENFNATVDELRTGFYAPIDKINKNSVMYKEWEKNKRTIIYHNSWGKAKIMNIILTQKHKDVLDCIILNAESINQLGGGRIEVLYNRSKVLKSLGHTKTNNHTWLDEKLRDIRQVEIEFEYKGEKRAFSILEERDSSESKDLGRIVFTSRYMKFFDDTTLINYKDEMSKLLSLDSGLLKAIVRFFWTHNNITMTIVGDNNKKGILETINYPISSDRQRQRAVKEIKDNAELLKEYGIIYEEDKKNKIKYLKKSYDNSITFYSAKNKLSIKEEQKEQISSKVDYINITDFNNQKFLDQESGLEFIIKDIRYNSSTKTAYMSGSDLDDIEILDVESVEKLKEFIEKCIK